MVHTFSATYMVISPVCMAYVVITSCIYEGVFISKIVQALLMDINKSVIDKNCMPVRSPLTIRMHIQDKIETGFFRF